MDNENSETENSQRLEWLDGDMPYSTAFGDHFYCREDGRAECGHVFLAGNGLPARWRESRSFVIGELGFGTGLNFCETWWQWQLTEGKPEGAHLHFISYELYPMDSASIDKSLGRWPELDAFRKALVSFWPARLQGTVRLQMAPDVTLSVVCGDALTSLAASTQQFDAWFLDGFAPSRNPAMWSLELMQRLVELTGIDGTFATYAAAGFVRRNLQAAGFAVERRPGFAGKREMLCGQKQ
jgi:tRNA U34 5-methylaminomethyl-2-thiouridine-forming methyltransferase MnmC